MPHKNYLIIPMSYCETGQEIATVLSELRNDHLASFAFDTADLRNARVVSDPPDAVPAAMLAALREIAALHPFSTDPVRIARAALAKAGVQS